MSRGSASDAQSKAVTTGNNAKLTGNQIVQPRVYFKVGHFLDTDEFVDRDQACVRFRRQLWTLRTRLANA
jgi:hypothetical protein